MRIIAGKAGRVRIRVPKGETRPTTDFVRQAVFSRLGERVVDARVLDLFAGSGAVGLEALSRGARSCTFVDESRGSEAVVRDNLTKAGLEGGQVVRGDVHGFLRRDAGGFDLIFADPPYARSLLDRDHVGELLGEVDWSRQLAPDGFLVVEQSADTEAGTSPALELVDRREYGGCAILLYALKGAS